MEMSDLSRDEWECLLRALRLQWSRDSALIGLKDGDWAARDRELIERLELEFHERTGQYGPPSETSSTRTWLALFKHQE
jgi:hypothetical protein